MFETQYNELALAVDLIVERIRSFGFPAPGTYSEFVHLGSIPETVGVPEAGEMICLLVEGQKVAVRPRVQYFQQPKKPRMRQPPTCLTQRIQLHERDGLDAPELVGEVGLVQRRRDSVSLEN